LPAIGNILTYISYRVYYRILRAEATQNHPGEPTEKKPPDTVGQSLF
jgi:hypothetical protein